MNPYEAARVRLEQTVATLRAAKKDKAEAEARLDTAEAEWAAADSRLRQYEQVPGVPLPQYREQVQA